MLVHSLVILSSSIAEQIDYLKNLHKGERFNLDELLLEFDDARFLWCEYDVKTNIMLKEIDALLCQIDDLELYELDDLNHSLWSNVRLSSNKVLTYIRNDVNSGG